MPSLARIDWTQHFKASNAKDQDDVPYDLTIMSIPHYKVHYSAASRSPVTNCVLHGATEVYTLYSLCETALGPMFVFLLMTGSQNKGKLLALHRN